MRCGVRQVGVVALFQQNPIDTDLLLAQIDFCICDVTRCQAYSQLRHLRPGFHPEIDLIESQSFGLNGPGDCCCIFGGGDGRALPGRKAYVALRQFYRGDSGHTTLQVDVVGFEDQLTDPGP